MRIQQPEAGGVGAFVDSLGKTELTALVELMALTRESPTSEDVAKLLHNVFTSPICILDGSYTPEASEGLTDDEAYKLAESLPRISAIQAIEIGHNVSLAGPVISGGRTIAVVCVLKPEGGKQHIESEFLEYVCDLLAACWKDDPTKIASIRIIKDIINGELVDADEIESWARGHGWSQHCGFRAYCIKPADEESRRLLSECVVRARQLLYPSEAFISNGSLAVVRAERGKEDIGTALGRIESLLAGAHALFAIGYSELADELCSLDVAYEHARFAASLAARHGKREMGYSDCRFEHFCARTRLIDEFANIQDPRVISLYEVDFARHRGLLDTSIAFIESGFSVGRAANRIGLHRNSVLYRLNRVAEYSGVDLLGSLEDFDLLTFLTTCKVYQARLPEDAVPTEWIRPC